MNGALLKWLDDPSPTRGLHVARADGSWDFRSHAVVAAEVWNAAAGLIDAGVHAGGVVSLLLSDAEEFIAAFFGCLAAGCTPSPIATPIGFRDGPTKFVDHVTGILRGARPAAVLSDEGILDPVAIACRQAGLDVQPTRFALGTRESDGGLHRRSDLALLQFTSGSSGVPKGVRISWDNLEGNVESIGRWVSWGADDSFATWLPLFHDMGLIGAMITPVTRGADLWIMSPMQFLRAPQRWVECFGRHQVTMTTAPSFGYAYAARKLSDKHLDGLDFSSWRVAISGAERIDPSAIGDFAARLAGHGFRPEALLGAYGLAEATLAVTGVAPGTHTRTVRLGAPLIQFGDAVAPAGHDLLGAPHCGDAGWLVSCGRPLSGMQVTIVDESGAALPDGRFGQIQVSGPSLAGGYRLAGGKEIDFDPNGWDTGDAGFVLDGELYVVGRTGDSLKVRGKRIFAEDVEAQLHAATGIRADKVAAVFGSVSGTDVAAVVIEDNGDAWLNDAVGLLSSVVSESVYAAVFRGERGAVLRTSSGKPRRRVLWQQLIEQRCEWELVWQSSAAHHVKGIRNDALASR